MSKEAIKTNVKNFIVTNFLFGNADSLEDSDSFMEKGIIDSTGILEVITFIEEEYNISIEENETLPENLDSLDNIANFVEKKTAA